MCHDASKTTRSCEDGSDALRLCNWAGVTTRGQLSPNIVAYDLRLAFRAKLGTRRASTRANMGAEDKIKAVSLRHSCERESIQTLTKRLRDHVHVSACLRLAALTLTPAEWHHWPAIVVADGLGLLVVFAIRLTAYCTLLVVVHDALRPKHVADLRARVW